MRATEIVRRGSCASFEVRYGSTSKSVTFEFPARLETTSRPDPLLPACLFPAMSLGDEVHLPPGVSRRLLDSSTFIQNVLLNWDHARHLKAPTFRRAAIHAQHPEAGAATRSTATACFFTGGVDSFHSALTHRDDIDALVYVYGFDVRLDDHTLRAQVSQHLHDAADLLELPLIEVVTDLRSFADECGVGWEDYHGAALATVAHLFGPTFGRWLIPATTTYTRLYALGSHPLLDPRWSSECVEIVHDGADATRVEKLRKISKHEAPRRHLRVCWENRNGDYNCGRCEKCLRTAVAARAAGVSDHFATLRAPRLHEIARVKLGGVGANWIDSRDELIRTGSDPLLKAAIDLVMGRRQVSQWPLVGRLFR